MNLPVCRWRREPCGPGRHMCLSPKLVVGPAGVPDEGCGPCRYRDHEPAARVGGHCVHLGRIVGEAVCPACSAAAGKSVSVPLHGCGVHGRCTMARESPGVRCCLTCADHHPAWRRDRAGQIRHLTYHVYPRGDVWKWNIAHLRQRMSLFNGRRLVAVAVDGFSDGLDAVRAELDGLGVDFLHFANDGNRREMVTHPELLAAVSDLTGDRDVTFYGHAKGIASSLIGDGVRRWAEEMYRANLDYWPAVRQKLRDHATCGILRRRTRHPPGVPVEWHYAGSFRWTRNSDLYCRDWRRIDPGWMGPETYPGRQFTYEESACLYGECVNWGASFYSADQWAGWTGAESDAWRIEHQADREQPLLLTVILTAHAQPELVHDAVASVVMQTADAWQLLIVSSGAIEQAHGDLWARYRDDARITVVQTGETASGVRRGQSWAINEAWRKGRVRGDLVLHLSDDDVLSPHAVESLLARARAQPGEGAWYGRARVERLFPNGSSKHVGTLGTCGVGSSFNRLRGRVDGMQVCHRREFKTDWPEDRGAAPMADGWWMDAMGEKVCLTPLDLEIGTHRHAPLSTFTQ